MRREERTERTGILDSIVPMSKQPIRETNRGTSENMNKIPREEKELKRSENEEADEWNEVQSRNRRIKNTRRIFPAGREVSRGKKSGSATLQAADRKIGLHVSRLSPSTDKGALERFPRENDIEGSIDIQKLNNRLNSKAFKVVMPTKYKNSVYEEDF